MLAFLVALDGVGDMRRAFQQHVGNALGGGVGGGAEAGRAGADNGYLDLIFWHAAPSLMLHAISHVETRAVHLQWTCCCVRAMAVAAGESGQRLPSRCLPSSCLAAPGMLLVRIRYNIIGYIGIAVPDCAGLPLFPQGRSMLIIPIQDRINWRRPPLLALALVLANILMNVFSLSHDRPHEQALDELDTAALAHYEWPLLLEYLQESDVMAWHEAREANEALAEQILWQHWFDREWDQHVHQVWTTLGEVDSGWRTAREKLEQHRNALSWVRWGFTPAEPTLAAAIISMFLHGDHWHLFGNMVFLLLFAPALERHWGALKLFMIYLVTGFSASLLHWAVDTNSTIPGIGASGAVSGLMGAYVATYGLRKIEFFYTVGFF